MLPQPIDVLNFDDIRPYRDEELPLALERIIREPLLYKMMKWIYPGISRGAVQQMLREVKTVRDFQEHISGPAFKVITQMTTNGLSFSNMEVVRKDRSYLFISNHRDIILDSVLLNVSLMEQGHATTEIAIGDNLLQSPFVADLVRSNKNFIVNRNVNAKEVYHYSLRLSNYIRDTIVRRNTSIWIAQREGRSKDGNDRTASGLLKMFTLSSDLPMEDALDDLNILPMAVSYEYDPCDLLKANELLFVRLTGSYEKKPGEDFRSMMSGLTGHKGRVNIAVGAPINGLLESMRAIQNKNEKVRFLADGIDDEMHRIYHLWPTNYIAYDLLTGERRFRDQYSNIQRIAFGNYIRGHVVRLLLIRKKAGLPKENFSKIAREILLQMYANPVINQLEVTSNVASERVGG
jgi:1-acyl-sn-glycerol-3-phosphate acyltransferase